MVKELVRGETGQGSHSPSDSHQEEAVTIVRAHLEANGGGLLPGCEVERHEPSEAAVLNTELW